MKEKSFSGNPFLPNRDCSLRSNLILRPHQLFADRIHISLVDFLPPVTRRNAFQQSQSFASEASLKFQVQTFESGQSLCFALSQTIIKLSEASTQCFSSE
jgi:hypothetical protein